MKKILLTALCLAFLPACASAAEKQVTIAGQIGTEGKMATDFMLDNGDAYSIEHANKKVMEQVYKYCTPKCKMTAIIFEDFYIDKILKIETIK